MVSPISVSISMGVISIVAGVRGKCALSFVDIHDSFFILLIYLPGVNTSTVRNDQYIHVRLLPHRYTVGCANTEGYACMNTIHQGSFLVPNLRFHIGCNPHWPGYRLPPHTYLLLYPASSSGRIPCSTLCCMGVPCSSVSAYSDKCSGCKAIAASSEYQPCIYCLIRQSEYEIEVQVVDPGCPRPIQQHSSHPQMNVAFPAGSAHSG